VELEVFALLSLERGWISVGFNPPRVKDHGIKPWRRLQVPVVYKRDPSPIKEVVNMGREQQTVVAINLLSVV
jgi:hypothetical protein